MVSRVRESRAYWVRDEVVDEPRDRDAEPFLPVAADDEPVGRRATHERAALEVGGLVHPDPPDEDEGGGDDTEAEREAPHGAKGVLAATAKNRVVG